METIKLTAVELDEIVCESSESYSVVHTKITGTFRHGNENSAVIKRVLDGKFFEVHYRDSVKDECGFLDMNSDGEYNEVIPVETTVIVYQTAP